MMATLESIAFSLPVAWARLYTLGLPDTERAHRIGQVASDVYEQRLDPEGNRQSAVFEPVVCLVGGILADITWRFERGHAHRVAAIRAGSPPFPVFVMALLAAAGLAGAFRLSVFHDLESADHVALILALLVGPLVGVLGVIIARANMTLGLMALIAGSASLAIAAWTTVLAPFAAAIGFGVGLFAILETRYAHQSLSIPGRSAAPTSPPQHRNLEMETHMETPDRLERWLSLGAILVLIGLAGSFWYEADFPFDGTDAEIQAWYADGKELVIYGSFFAGLAGAVGLLLFFGGLYGAIRRAEGGSGYLSALMLAGAAAGAALVMLESTLGSSVGMAYAFDDKYEAGGIDPQVVRLLSATAFALQAMASAALAVALGALAVVAFRFAALPRWLSWSTVAVAVLLLLTFPLFGMTYPLFVLWTLVVAGWRLTRGSRPQPIAHGASPAPA